MPAAMRRRMRAHWRAAAPVTHAHACTRARAALRRYIGRKYHMMGANEKEMVLVDMIMEGVESLRTKYINLIYNDKLVSHHVTHPG